MSEEEDYTYLKDFFYYKNGDLYWKVDKGRAKKDSRAGRYTGPNKNRRQVSVNNKLLGVHRVVWYLHYGYMPKVLDHIDRNPENNSIENLRECDFRLNGANKTKGNVGYKGVQYYSGLENPWRVYVGRLYIGYFKTEDEAKAAYYGAAKVLYGEFATLGE